MRVYNHFARSLELCKNDLIIADQTNDLMLHIKALIRINALSLQLVNHVRSSIMIANDSLTKEQVAELTQYELSLNTLRGM